MTSSFDRKSDRRTTRRQWARSVGHAVAVAAIASIAVGCAKREPVITGSVPQDGYRSMHPIVISEVPESMDIPVGVHGGNISPAMAGAVVNFAENAQLHGNGAIEVMVPSGSRNETAALYVAERIERVLIKAGIRRNRLSRRAYGVEDTRAVAPVRLSYSRVKAVVHKCGLWPDQMTTTNRNGGYSEFGCSTQSNLAAMVSNPADLLYPRGSSPADAMRREEVHKRYRKGEDPSTKYSDGDKGEVSDQ